MRYKLTNAGRDYLVVDTKSTLDTIACFHYFDLAQAYVEYLNIKDKMVTHFYDELEKELDVV